jgi:hypothetical protein
VLDFYEFVVCDDVNAIIAERDLDTSIPRGVAFLELAM